MARTRVSKLAALRYFRCFDEQIGAEFYFDPKTGENAMRGGDTSGKLFPRSAGSPPSPPSKVLFQGVAFACTLATGFVRNVSFWGPSGRSNNIVLDGKAHVEAHFSFSAIHAAGDAEVSQGKTDAEDVSQSNDALQNSWASYWYFGFS